MFRPASLLTTPVAPTDTTSVVWQPWFLRPSLSWFVTSPRPGYANRPNRAIDGMRTFTSSDAQPCRLLPERPASTHAIATRDDRSLPSGADHAARNDIDVVIHLTRHTLVEK